MNNLGILDLYEKCSENNSVQEFAEKTESTLKVEIEKKAATLDIEWLEIIEHTIPYLDNIFRSPNRVIVNEEEVVKIEQAKKITVETIKHLSKNTNLIQTLDEETGDVTPFKLLNVRKEESYDTYENRLIYTLIQNTRMFINKKKEELLNIVNIEDEEKQNKNNKILEYNAVSSVKDEKIEIKLNLNSHLDFSGYISKEKISLIMERIQEVERKLQTLTYSETYQVIDKQHITLVREPIKKTNVVLKNVNFQYAMKLWSYLRENYDGSFEEDSENKNYNDEGELKQLVDETFLLQYLAMKTLDEDQVENEVTQKQLQENIIEQMIEKMLDMDTEITEDQLQRMIVGKYEVVKYKKMEVLKDIQQIFRSHFEKYEEQVEQRRKSK